METVEPLAAHFLPISANVFLYCALWSALIVVTYRSLTKRKFIETSCPTRPGLKIPIYSIFGDLRFLPSNSVMKTLLLPPTVFCIHIASGIAAIFPKEKVNFCLAGYARFVFVTKPESVEVIRQRKEDKMKKQNGEELFDDNKKKRKALLDLLLDLHIAGRDFTEEDIREEIDTILFAGQDTSAVGTSWALYLIGLYPEIQNKIHEELDMIFGDDYDISVTMDKLREMHYLERVLKESQRLYPSVAAFGRKVEDDFYLCGRKIKKGTTLGLLPYVLHRNPEVFPDPEKFDPDRFLPENCVGRHPFSYVPFSAGPRNCIGQRFAMLEEKTLVANVLRNFSVKSLEQRDKVFPSAEIVLRPFNPLKLKFTPRD